MNQHVPIPAAGQPVMHFGEYNQWHRGAHLWQGHYHQQWIQGGQPPPPPAPQIPLGSHEPDSQPAVQKGDAQRVLEGLEVTASGGSHQSPAVRLEEFDSSSSSSSSDEEEEEAAAGGNGAAPHNAEVEGSKNMPTIATSSAGAEVDKAVRVALSLDEGEKNVAVDEEETLVAITLNKREIFELRTLFLNLRNECLDLEGGSSLLGLLGRPPRKFGDKFTTTEHERLQRAYVLQEYFKSKNRRHELDLDVLYNCVLKKIKAFDAMSERELQNYWDSAKSGGKGNVAAGKTRRVDARREFEERYGGRRVASMTSEDLLGALELTAEDNH